MTHPGSGYPLSGCSPAEPDSVSPGAVHDRRLTAGDQAGSVGRSSESGVPSHARSPVVPADSGTDGTRCTGSLSRGGFNHVEQFRLSVLLLIAESITGRTDLAVVAIEQALHERLKYESLVATGGRLVGAAAVTRTGMFQGGANAPELSQALIETLNAPGRK